MTPIRSFEPKYSAAFALLNYDWLQKYFIVEPVDRKILGDPQRYIIDRGGEILLAIEGFEVIGCVALMPHKNELELTKMAVRPDAQGHGLGRRLVRAAIDYFRESNAKKLFLETNSRLKPALNLYRSEGFVETPHPLGRSKYARGNVYMVWREPKDA